MRGFYTDSDDSQLNEKTTVSAMTSLDLDKDSVSIAVGSMEKVTATTAPADNNDVVLWKSDNSRVASVSNGRIHARRIGTATITAFAQSGSVEKKITVTVTKKTLEKETTDIQTDYDAFILMNLHVMSRLLQTFRKQRLQREQQKNKSLIKI